MRIFRLRLLSVVAGICLSSLAFTQDLYDPEQISEIEINFYDANWDAILDAYMAADSDERILADVSINGMAFDSVGVRYKGNSSYRANQVKNPLNIKLNYVKNQDYQGYYTLKLSNGFKDPSFVREVLALEIARKYMPAARAGYANITINGSPIGLFTNVQSINDVFTQEHYYSEDRPFFEGDGDGPTPSGCSYNNWAYMGTDSTSCYPYYYESKSGDNYGALIDFLDVFNNDPNAMEDSYNVDRHLWSMAYDIALVNLDAPISMAHNFYLYYDETRRFNYIKWDLNECFGVFQRLGNSQLDLTGMQQLDPYTSNTPDNPILYKVWQNERWKKMYMAHMLTLMEENIGSAWYMERAVELQTYIDQAIQNDPNKFFTYAQTKANLNSTVDRSVGISELMDARLTFLNNTSYFQYTQPEIADISHLPESLEANSEVSILAEISNADYVFLAYRSDFGGLFEKVEMADDGMHNDGEAGDGIWGVTLPMGTSMEYYIYAENEDAGSFSPVRAEYEFHTLTTAGDLVINELMASNLLSVADQNGEFDDWIELYNNTDSEISLTGYTLSDDPEEAGKWLFPDISVAARSYLIIWADKDTLQAGLHANFKLSASGENLILSNASGDVLDQVSFPPQSSNISWARSPNGTGNFKSLAPTFEAENEGVIASSPATVQLPDVRLYPNPAGDMLNIRVADNDEHQLCLYNIFGQCLQQLPVHGIQTMDVSSLEPGIYLITVDGKSGAKFIKR